MTCSIEGCENKAKCRGYCNKHYLKLWRHGDAEHGRTFRQRGTGWVRVDGYHMTGNKLEHRKIMEDVLGRKLTRKEVVHHIDGNRLNNNPENLMVFPSQAEHAAHHAELNRQARTNQ